MNSLLSLPIAYLLGSIPTAVWVAKIVNGKDYDIRNYGSKNSGLTNTIRVLGVKPALPVVIVDLLKGFFAPTIASLMNEASKASGGPDYFWLPLVCGLLAILGHSFTCFAGFRGGKGVLTAFGVFLALAPVTALGAFAVWCLLTFTTKYVSVGSIFACITLAGLATFGYVAPGIYPHDHINEGILVIAWIVAVFVIYKHKANIKRLMNGTENGFGKKKKKV
ncbi:MAG: glycerol-3-phosphate 1-O-acyltransferase PlsY [Fibrobacter sp.]|nr:glycerol-3-phosphate 1-O-acyltransferase PlsY [Fibrobacter sp.]